MKSDEKNRRFCDDLHATLETIGVGWQRNVYRQGFEIAWRHASPHVEETPATEVENLPGIAVSAARVTWSEVVSVVFWSDVDVERLLRLAFYSKRAIEAVLSRRTQWEVETFCTELERIERELTGKDPDDEGDSGGE